MRGAIVAVKAFRRDSGNQRFEKDGEGLPRIALSRNTANARLAARFESRAIRPSATRGRRTEYRVRSDHDEASGRRRRPRQGLPITKLGLRRREKLTPKRYRPQTGANTVLKRGSCLRPQKALRWRRAPKAYARFAASQKWRTTFSPAPAARGDAVNVAERERLEFRWLALNRQQYAGRWVALDGNRLLAVGDSAREVYAAIASDEVTPLVTRVEPEDEVYFAGW
jgi:hypothetical protein